MGTEFKAWVRSIDEKILAPPACEMFLAYSRVSNKRRVWNNRIGWTFISKKINVQYGITVLGGEN